MIMENHPWLLPAWLIGVPFVLGVIEFVRIEGLRKGHLGLDSRADPRDGGLVARSSERRTMLPPDSA